MEWNDIKDWNTFREKSANLAGKSWLVADAGLLGKSFYENQSDITSILSLDTLAGILFISSAYLLNKKGDTHEGTYQAMALSFLAYASIISSQIMSDKYSSLTGLFIGATACAWAGLAALYGSKKEKNNQEDKIDRKENIYNSLEETKDTIIGSYPKITQLFKETKDTIINKYPNLIPMTANTVSNTLVVVGGIADKDFYLATLGVMWGVGSVLMAVSKQKTENKSTPEPS